jgi:hypothetical protein
MGHDDEALNWLCPMTFFRGRKEGIFGDKAVD